MPPIYKLHTANGPRDRDDLPALFRSGNESLARGDFATAAEQFRRVLAAVPDSAEAHNNLGVALKRQQKLNEAGAAFQQAVAARSDFVDAYVNLGDTLRQLDRLDDARMCLQAALEVDANCAAAHNNLGIVHRRLGDYDAAIECFTRALEIRPDYTDAANNLGNLYVLTNRREEAETQFARAAQSNTQSLDAHNHLGMLRQRQGRLQEAEEEFLAAIALDAGYVHAHINLGVLYQFEGRVDEAQNCFRKAHALQPQFVPAHSNLLISLGYDPHVAPDDLFAEHCRWNELHTAALPRPLKYPHERDPHRRLRIGYVSADFRGHPVAAFVEPILRHHDRTRIEVVCYSDVPRDDDVTEQLKKCADEWRVVSGMPDAELAELIARDRIDILVDLAGHTAGNRLPVFARKPAPVQFSMIGYGPTTGLPAIDYRLTDDVCDPLDEPPRHTETLVRIPRGSFVYAMPQAAPDVGPPPAIANGYVTFGSFNNLAKVGPEVVALWSEILTAIPNSRLLMKNAAFEDGGVCQRYRELFARHHIRPQRLLFRGYAESTEEHLAAFHDVDVALDPFPYTGATTTCEALWMGVPVVTLRGRSYVGRMSASILTHAGCGYLVSDSPAQYVSTAIGLASDMRELETIRGNLREQLQSAPMCQATEIVAEIEEAYREAWRRWCEE